MKGVRDKVISAFTDWKQPSAFSGVAKVAKQAGVKNEEARKILELEKESYALHKPVRLHFKRRKTVGIGPFTKIQADLADFQSLSKHNRGIKYLLVIVDCYTRMLYLQPVKNKTAPVVRDAFIAVFKKHGFLPTRIITDNGGEFYGKACRDFFKKHCIQHYSPYTEIKASMAERGTLCIMCPPCYTCICSNPHNPREDPPMVHGDGAAQLDQNHRSASP